MKYDLRPFQRVGVDHAVDFLTSAKQGDKLLYAAPTGVGKSIVQLAIRERFPDLWIVTPRDEIIDGFLDKLGAEDALDARISTPVKLRNRLLEGLFRPSHMIFDEGHHHEAETWQQLSLLTGLAPALAYTATPYRGTPKSTKQFLEHWGEPQWLITYREAIAEKYIRMPIMSILPLVDDDIVDVKGGDFEVTSLDAATMDRLGDIADHSRAWYNGIWDKATVYAVPSSLSAIRLQQELGRVGIPAAIISAGTPKAERRTIFEACRHRIMALIHINIVSEGVDEPFRRYVDLAPTMSPVNWVQKLGRIMRPTDEVPEYICTNRNILRHAYALEGIVPISVISKGEQLFGPTQRAHTRVLGLESIGRFKPTTTKCLDGCNIYVYALSVLENNVVVEYSCLVHPAKDPVWACKVSTVNEDRTRNYGKWRLCPAPSDLRGFASKGTKDPSPKQLQWWARSAHRYGLDPEQEVTRKSFTALPVLSDIGGWPA